MSRWIGPAALSILVVITAWACDHQRPEGGLRDEVPALLEALLDSAFLEGGTVPGAMLRVEEGPAPRFVWEGVRGTVDRESDAALRPGHTLRIASVTKTFVAAAVLRLAEEGRLDVEDPMGPHLLPGTARLLRSSGYDPSAITVRMALQHTGGLADYATEDVFVERILAEPTHRWTREEQLRLAMELGGPVAAPGARFHYSDTGYILLGEIVEQVSASPLHLALRELLAFDELGLTATWMESAEHAPPGAPPRAHQYLDSLDTHGFDPSFDLFGGGGLVSNLRDLSVFFRALFEGRVFRHPESLARMTTATRESRSESGGAGYGMGMAVVDYGGHRCYGHGGFWGILIRYCPGADVLVAGAVTSTSGTAMLDALVRQALTLMQNGAGPDSYRAARGP